jgi:class 3 adenylate cyclase
MRAHMDAPQRLDHLYRSNLQSRWLQGEPTVSWREQEGTLLLLDFSGFIRGAERMVRRRKIEAHQLSAVLNVVYGDLLDVAAALGGDCLRLDGAGPLLFFSGDGHAESADAAARRLMQAVRNFQQFRSVTGLEHLNATVRTRSGQVMFAMAGKMPRELVVIRPALGSVGRRGSSRRLALVDEVSGVTILRGSWHSSASAGIEPALADVLVHQPQTGVHRTASIGCVTFCGTRRVWHDCGPDAVSQAIDEVFAGVQHFATEYDLTWLGCELEGDVGRVTLAAGLPVPASDDARRLLSALRATLDRIDGPLQLRAGADRGRVFAADVGSESRRGYMVVGDTVAVAAQLAGHAEVGRVLPSQPLMADSPVGVPA